MNQIPDEAPEAVTAWPPNPDVVGSDADVSDWVRSERERAFLSQVSDVLASSIDYEVTLAAVTRLAVQGMADWCVVDEMAPDGSIRRISVAHSDPELVKLAEQLNQKYPPDPNAPYGVPHVLRTRQPEFVADLPDELLVRAARDEEHLRIIRELGITSYITVPLIARNHLLGALTFVAGGGLRRFEERDLRVAQELARRAAIAIDNARLYRQSEEARARLEEQAIELESQAEELQATQSELELSNDDLQNANVELELRISEADRAVAAADAAGERLRLLAEAGSILGASLDFQATLRDFTRLVVPALADWCCVEIPSETNGIDLVAVHHADPSRVELTREALRRYANAPDAQYGPAMVLRTGEPVLLLEISDDLLEAVARDPDHRALLREIGFHSALSVPLIVRGRTLGVLSVATAGSPRRLGHEDLSLAQELARRVALAMDNARLYAAEQDARRSAERESDRSRRLQLIAAALNQAATSEQVAEVCVVQGIDALDADAGSLALLVEDGAAFEVVNTVGFPSHIGEQWRRFPLTPGMPLSDAVAEREAVLLSDSEEWQARYPKAFRDIIRTGTIGYAALPLVVGNESIAGLSFCFSEARGFDDADRRFLAMLGEQAAQALERARLFEAEQKARLEAEVANRAKADFLSAMSHELRTPLNAIAGYVDLLEAGVRGQLTESQLRDLGRVKHAQGILLGLIDDILSFARIEAGRIEFRPEIIPLREILDSLEKIIGPQLSLKRLQYRCEPDPQALFVLADPDRIRQILINLLSNAVKFTDVNGWIGVRTERNQDQILIHVADAGRGIPAEKFNEIFDPFVQLGRGTTAESQQGVGLGLAISRELARGMGGDLTVESVLGEGSVFTLSLPSAKP